MPDVALPEKRKVGSSTLPLTTSFGLVSSALTSANADWVLSCPQPPSDHDSLCVTVVGRSRNGRLVRRAVISGLTRDNWHDRWQKR